MSFQQQQDQMTYADNPVEKKDTSPESNFYDAVGASVGESEDATPLSVENRVRRRLPFLVACIISMLSDAALFFVLLIFAVLTEKDMLRSTTKKGFFIDDRSIQYPHSEKSTVPTSLLALVSIVVPILVIIVVEVALFIQYRVIKGRALKKSWWALIQNFINNLFVFAFGLLMTCLITFTIKSLFGELRPDFVARCNMDMSQLNSSISFITPEMQKALCRGTKKAITEGRKAFPSGHTSISTFSMTFAAMYLERVHFSTLFTAWKPTLQFLLLLFAIFTSISRITDYMHSFVDVCFGAILGLATAFYFEYVVRRRHTLPVDQLFVDPRKHE